MPHTQDAHEVNARPSIQFSLQRRWSRTSLAVAAAKTSSVRPKAQRAVFFLFSAVWMRLRSEGPYSTWRTSIAITVRAATHSELPAASMAVITNWLAPA
ncbi:hypothetical protein SB00610_03866 [Klebsiella quasipneumoniae subsp. similipneumoniae]|nr:hypothetical protein SB00610_03866 [Klebsiella quasipneumoniae subsp. similipneumoniae]